MKILHVSDTHLGYSAYRKVTEEGINQRELDTYEAFSQFIKYAIDAKPDLIIHAGDLFDSVRPNNRAITFAINQIIKLSNEKIPILIIAGNHEHPKLKETGHIFSIFDHIENVYPVYSAKYEKINFKIKDKNLTIHAVPQCELKKDFKKELKKIKIDKDSDFNILVSHGAVSGIHVFSMNEFNELFLPVESMEKDFDYIALGHYHKYTKVSKNAYYSGSTERFTFIDANDKKGFIELSLKNNKFTHRFIELENRKMIDTKPIKCKNLKLEEVMKKIKQNLRETKPAQKTYRMTLDDIPAHIYRNLDFNEIRKITSNAVHFELKADIVKEENLKKSSSSKIDALANEFKKFLEEQKIEESKKIMELGIAYIDKIEAREEGK